MLEEDASRGYAALLIDYPVLLRSIHAVDADAAPRLADIVHRAQALGRILTSRAYGGWYDLEEAQNAFTSGVDPVFVPPTGPGSVPSTSALVADGLTLIEAGRIQALALSGDDRLLPLIAAAHQAGIAVALVAHSCTPDGPCVKLAGPGEPAAAFARLLSRAEKYRRGPQPARSA